MALLSPERPLDLSPAPNREPSLPLFRPGATRDLGRTLADRVVVAATILWLVGRLVALGIARLVDWFAADPRRIRVAAAGLTASAAVGAAIGIVVGALLAGCWSVAHAVVLGDLT